VLLLLRSDVDFCIEGARWIAGDTIHVDGGSQF
jgi:hypothetical protein